MDIKILNKEILEQHSWDFSWIIEQARATGGVAYRIDFEYNEHRGVLLTCISKNIIEDAFISLDDIL